MSALDGTTIEVTQWLPKFAEPGGLVPQPSSMIATSFLVLLQL